MKAESEVLIGVQRPYSFFGIPPFLGGIALVCSLGLVPLMSALGIQFMVLFGPLIALSLSGAWLWHQNRHDHHFEQKLMIPGRYFKGKHKQGRTLHAGGAA